MAEFARSQIEYTKMEDIVIKSTISYNSNNLNLDSMMKNMNTLKYFMSLMISLKQIYVMKKIYQNGC